MRPVLPAEVSRAARHLLRLPPEGRAAAARRLVWHAHWADRWRKRTGRLHPGWGDGSLGAAVPPGSLPLEPTWDDPDYARCIAEVLCALVEWREDESRLSRVRRRRSGSPRGRSRAA